jgi:uncharacterized Zn finger protein
MICASCGHSWEIQRAHVIRSERTTDGCRELIQCPACGRVQSVLMPDMDGCNGD